MKQDYYTGSLDRENEELSPNRRSLLLPILFLCLMGAAFVLTVAVLPLYSLFFSAAFPNTAFQTWLLKIPTLFFPGQAVISAKQIPNLAPIIPVIGSWSETIGLFLVFALLVLIYALAIRFVAAYVSPRYIFLSTLLFGVICVFSPALTSQDLYSYAFYARIGIIHHLNPLTTLPIAVPTDPLYPYIFWSRQPSAYGPTWIVVTSLLQLITLPLGTQNTLPLLLLLRLLGLITHLGSTVMIWRMSNAFNSGLSRRAKLTALLMFAWNPLLLIEACVNAHNDTVALFLLLTIAWLLLPHYEKTGQRYLLAAVLLAVVTGLKITYGLFLSGLLLFLWAQERPFAMRIRQIIVASSAFAVTLIILYAPFWQQGAALRFLQVNPGITRDINSPYQFLIALVYNNLLGKSVPFVSNDVGTPAEILSHRIALFCFIVLYSGIILWYITHRHHMNTLPALIRWMALTWLLYCLVGSPWFWPWYICPFLGLGVLVMSLVGTDASLFRGLRLRPAIFWLTFSMLCMYCFFTWIPHRSTIPLTPIHWGSITGLWAWIFLLLALNIPTFLIRNRKRKVSVESSRFA